jgi:hypothetical protein
MTTEIRLAQFGMGMQEGTLLKWLKAEGDSVQEGEIIAEVEAAKSIVEICSPATGVISRLMVKADETVPVQAVLATISDAADYAAKSAHVSSRRQVEPRARRLAQQNLIDLAIVPGTERITETDIEKIVAANEARRPPSDAIERDVAEVDPNKGLSIEQQNLRIVRDEFYGGIAANDWTRAEAVLDHDLIEVHEADGLPYGGVWKGIEGFRRITKIIHETWKPLDWKVLQYATGGDLVMVYFQLSGAGRNSTAFSMPVVEILRFKNHKVIEIRVMYWDTKRIRDCAGI